ncbi:MAG: hypothetical protein AAF533_14885 [Acidobacteriota bacterium]
MLGHSRWGSWLLVLSLTSASVTARTWHEIIQDGVAEPLPAERFLGLEQDAFARPADPAVHPPLVEAYAPTTEKVWAVIHAEVGASLTGDDGERARLGAQAFRLLADSVAMQPGEDGKTAAEISLTTIIEADVLHVTMGKNYEISFMLGLLTQRESEGALAPGELTLRDAHLARLGQLHVLTERGFPSTELTRRQREVQDAGHAEARDYWLFGAARPAERDAWLAANADAQAAWLAWREAHPFEPTTPDYQRRFRFPIEPDEGTVQSEPRRVASRLLDAGYGPWKLGMSREQVEAVTAHAPYAPVQLTGGLETSSGRFRDEQAKVSFVFDENDCVALIQVWVHVGDLLEPALDAAWRAASHLRSEHGHLVSPDTTQLATQRRAFTKQGRQAMKSWKPGSTVVFRWSPLTAPSDHVVHGGLFHAADGTFFVLLFHETPGYGAERQRRARLMQQSSGGG